MLCAVSGCCPADVKPNAARGVRQESTLIKVTYRQIQASVKETAGFVPKRDWIAHVKELNGLPLKHTHKRRTKRLEPCPVAKRKAIEDALRRFGFLPSGRES